MKAFIDVVALFCGVVVGFVLSTVIYVYLMEVL